MGDNAPLLRSRRQSVLALEGEKNVRYPLIAVVAFGMLAGAGLVAAQTPSNGGQSTSTNRVGVPFESLVASVAKKTGKKFVLDPRVHADILLVGQEPSELTYPQFLAVLEVYGFAAVENSGLIEIVPDANVRQQIIPTITSKDTFPASEYVTQIIRLKYASAAQLVPILRPMIAQYGHLAAVLPENALLITDRFANVRRIEDLIKAVDTPENKPVPTKEVERPQSP